MPRLPTEGARVLCRAEDSVSPVIGTIFILAITIVGIAGVLYYGAPTIDRIQSRNAQTAMEGNFESLRDAAQELSVPDHARKPTVTMSGGQLAIAVGDRFMIASDHDPAHTACDLHVTDWADAGANKGSVTIIATGCASPTTACTPPVAAGSACLEIDSVTGGTLTKCSPPGSATTPTCSISGVAQDFSKGDWLFRLTDGNANPVVYAEAWLMSSDQLMWDLQSSTGRWQEFLDGGAVFGQSGGGYSLEKEAPIGDTAFGSAYYGFWMRSLVADAGHYTSIQGGSSHAVSLTLLGVWTRTDESTVYKLRYDFAGPLAQPWCNALLLRNPRLTAAAYADTTGYTCATGGAGDSVGLRSVSYARTGGSAFAFRLLHARIATSLAV